MVEERLENENSSAPVDMKRESVEKSTKDPEKHTIREIIGALTLKQVWGILGALGVSLVAIFGIGYGLRENLAKAELQHKQNEIDTLNKKLEETDKFYQNTDIKEEFLTLYARYLNAKESGKESESAAKNMAGFINTQLETAKSNRTTPEKKITALRVGRGATPQDSTIIFSGDNSTWILPQEVIKHVHENLLNNDTLPKQSRTEVAPKEEKSKSRE